jgi:MoaA/NifB/PqqE/SkfB family radical SAM enzyme
MTTHMSRGSGDGHEDLMAADGSMPSPFQAAVAREVVRLLAWVAPKVARIGLIRRSIANAYEQRLRAGSRKELAAGFYPPGVIEDRAEMGVVIMRAVERALAKGLLGPASLRKLLKILVGDVLIKQGDWSVKARFKAERGGDPPDLLLISPTKTCNLRCIGCYADSGPTREKLDWAVLDRLVGEAHDLWGTRFFVFSGGEPMAYRDDGKGVLDLAEKHDDCFFMMYTNGTLIDDHVARRMGELGNVTPAISVEGLREPTDQRRGAGVFDRILAAMERLRREKVLFGISLTATRLNAEIVLADEVVDFFFGEMGALYAWVFHYMPIGRAFTLELMMTPQQRLALWQRARHLVYDRHLFVADFWSGGTASYGCIAAGRQGGYMAVDWNGAVMPCVFAPYSPVNLNEAYARGQTLNDVWAQPFFASLRDWQNDLGFGRNWKNTAHRGNWMMPCPIRDHHAEFHQLVRAHEPEPTDENAAAALMDPEYHAGLEQFDRDLAELYDPIWKARYLRTDD